MNSWCSVYSQDPWLCPELAWLCREEGATAPFYLQQYFQAGYRLHHPQVAWGPWSHSSSEVMWGIKYGLLLPPALPPGTVPLAEAGEDSGDAQRSLSCQESPLLSIFRSIQHFFCLVCSAVEVDPPYACCVVILFYFFYIN